MATKYEWYCAVDKQGKILDTVRRDCKMKAEWYFGAVLTPNEKRDWILGGAVIMTKAEWQEAQHANS